MARGRSLSPSGSAGLAGFCRGCRPGLPGGAGAARASGVPRARRDPTRHPRHPPPAAPERGPVARLIAMVSIWRAAKPRPLALDHLAAFERDTAIEALARYSLIRAEPATLAVHRLIQAVTRDGLDGLTRANPGGSGGPAPPGCLAGTAVGAHPLAAHRRPAAARAHLHEPCRAAPGCPAYDGNSIE